jgi:hypothetical protein
MEVTAGMLLRDDDATVPLNECLEEKVREVAAEADPAFEIGNLYRRGIEAWIQVGEKLLAEKKRMPHGEWLRWLHDNKEKLGFDERTAQRFMELAANPSLASDSETLWKRRRITNQKPKKNKDHVVATDNAAAPQEGDGDRQAGSLANNVSNDDHATVTPQESAAAQQAEFLANAIASMQAAHYDGVVSDEIITAARWTAEAWAKLADDLEARRAVAPVVPPVDTSLPEPRAGNSVDTDASADARKAAYAAGEADASAMAEAKLQAGGDDRFAIPDDLSIPVFMQRGRAA